MHLQEASRRELSRIAGGTAICTAAMWVIFAALHLVGWAPFDASVLLGGAIGAFIAVANFWGICITMQAATGETNEKKRKARIQLSYNLRMLGMGLWVLFAIVLPSISWVAAVVPLAFPRIVIYYLQATGRYKPDTAKGGPEASAEDAADAAAPPAAPSPEAQDTPPHAEGGER